ncbi:hypothetical protein [Melittangium boletus]|uniref:Flagellar biosynthesis protein FliO n=1 Tax=Melittangium boletus DSM 14713 TaxID=1294270 RepID=A0A250I7K5_9BACT|nr:hypothetical protein [Melittangium boletus]ATB27859.1 hypothetical protein MEBOL_001304 [Melittangium boletus DSM 14713]
MNPSLWFMSPRARMVLALGLVLALAVMARWGETSVTSVARVLLGGVALVVGVGWLRRRDRSGTRFMRAEPLRVVSRAGLSQRCGLALVDVEGSHYLVVFGDSFSEIRRMRGPVREKPRSGRCTGGHSLAKESLS